MTSETFMTLSIPSDVPAVKPTCVGVPEGPPEGKNSPPGSGAGVAVGPRAVEAAIAGGSAAAIVVGAVAGTGTAADVAFAIAAIAAAVIAVVTVRSTRLIHRVPPGATFAVVFAIAAVVHASSATDVINGLALTAGAGLVLWALARPGPLPGADSDVASGPSARPFVISATVVFVVFVVVYSIYSVERHQRFGSGSWDFGCYVHNAWLFAHGDAFSLAARSSVLGDVAFWGGTNHFMPSLVLTAPLSWIMEALGDTSALAVAQNVVVVATVFPISMFARARGLSWPISTALCLAFVLHPGVQAALLFDVHEVAPVPALMALALALSTSPPSPKRVFAVAACLLLMAGTKESSWLVAASSAGAIAVSEARWRRVAGVFVVVFIVGFVVVVGLIQPGLLEPGATMMHAARFVGVGDTPATSLSSAVLSHLTHPGQTVLMIFDPATKLRALSTSTLAMGALPWASAAGVVGGLSNIAERFLSDKQEMWGLAFHYGLVTAGWMAFAAVDVVAAASARRRRALVICLVAGAVVAAVTTSRPYDLGAWEQPYYASDDDVARYTRALAVIGDDDAVIAQNHFLPHLAARRHIWQPERRFIDRADVVILDDEASPWPHSSRHVRQLITQLQRDPRFQVAFHEGSTWVFRRTPPSPAPLDGAAKRRMLQLGHGPP